MNKDHIVIIIPVYNDASSLRTVLMGLHANDYNDIVVVDDGSEQDIHKEIKDLSVHYLRHVVNLGQGAAIQTGIDYAKNLGADIFVTFDADGQHDPADIATLTEPLINKEADITLGSRFLKRPQIYVPWPRKFLLQCARIINWMFSGILLSDAHNGLRAMNMKALSAIRITENRMAHATEILLIIKEHQLRYREIGVNIRYTKYSRAKGQSGWDSIRILFDLFLHKIFK
jgi:glycosyltransferase involved in cell wall biosynthesis